MTFLGFAIGSRPSTLRPLRRKGSTPDLLTDEGLILLRRLHSLRTEIMDETKTARDQEIPLPPLVLWVLREHISALEGVMAESEYLFPSITGGLRARSVLDEPFANVNDQIVGSRPDSPSPSPSPSTRARAAGVCARACVGAICRTFRGFALASTVHPSSAAAVAAT